MVIDLFFYGMIFLLGIIGVIVGFALIIMNLFDDREDKKMIDKIRKLNTPY